MSTGICAAAAVLSSLSRTAASPCSCRAVSSYADLWYHGCMFQHPSVDGTTVATMDAFRQGAWTRQDPRLPDDWAAPEWHRDQALRTDYARRQAFGETDVLATKALSLALDELKTIYRVQFPAMRQYEAERYYDASGRIVFTSSKGLPGVGLLRKAIKGDTGYTLTTRHGTRTRLALGLELRTLTAV